MYLESVNATGWYEVKCLDADGKLKWEDGINNIVVTVGKANLLNVFLASSTQTTTWYLGLVNGATTPTYNDADVMNSHAGWAEDLNYSQTSRPQAVFGTPTSTSSISSSQATFNINANATIAGAFLVNNSTKNGTIGTLYSAGSFASSRTVISGDSLLVTYTAAV